MEELVRLDKTANSLAAMATLIMSIRVLKLFSPFPKLRILAGTLEVALPALGWFCIVFFMLFFAWCAAGVILFGNVIPAFQTFGTAIIHLQHLLLLGENSYEAMAAESLAVALVFFWSFLLLLYITLLNIALAIVIDSYAEVKDATSELIEQERDLYGGRDAVLDCMKDHLSLRLAFVRTTSYMFPWW